MFSIISGTVGFRNPIISLEFNGKLLAKHI